MCDLLEKFNTTYDIDMGILCWDVLCLSLIIYIKLVNELNVYLYEVMKKAKTKPNLWKINCTVLLNFMITLNLVFPSVMWLYILYIVNIYIKYIFLHPDCSIPSFLSFSFHALTSPSIYSSSVFVQKGSHGYQQSMVYQDALRSTPPPVFRLNKTIHQ